MNPDPENRSHPGLALLLEHLLLLIRQIFMERHNEIGSQLEEVERLLQQNARGSDIDPRVSEEFSGISRILHSNQPSQEQTLSSMSMLVLKLQSSSEDSSSRPAAAPMAHLSIRQLRTLFNQPGSKVDSPQLCQLRRSLSQLLQSDKDLGLVATLFILRAASASDLAQRQKKSEPVIWRMLEEAARRICLVKI